MNKLKNSSVLITGGTGSFGRTFARELIDIGAREVRIFSRDEAKQDQMRSEIADDRLVFLLGDTRDLGSVDGAMKGADYVFHAAALKQVPSGEFFPLEVTKTNILGSANVIDSAVSNGAKAIVCLSTDKAVYPINAMGMSKAMMEKIALAKAREASGEGTRISVTRYGNVMMSRGSVIPKFIEQIKRGEPVTITSSEMTRFLMSLADSVDLVSHALVFSNPGDIFVRKAPGALTIDVARALSEILEVPFKAHNVGVRHGEKFHEALLSSEERGKAVDEHNFFRVPMDVRDLNYKPYFEQGANYASEPSPYTSENTERLGVPEIKRLLLNLPEMRLFLGEVRG